MKCANGRAEAKFKAIFESRRIGASLGLVPCSAEMSILMSKRRMVELKQDAKA